MSLSSPKQTADPVSQSKSDAAYFVTLTAIVCVAAAFSGWYLARHGAPFSAFFTVILISLTFVTTAFITLHNKRLRKIIDDMSSLSGAIDQKDMNIARLTLETVETNQLMEQVSIHFSELFQKIPAPCFCFDSDGRFKEWNRAFESLTLLEPRTLVNAPVADFISVGSDPAKMLAAIAGVFNGESYEGIELQTTYSAGAAKTVLCNMFPLRGDGGVITAAICAGVDISERIRLEERMLKHVQMLSAAQVKLEEQHAELVATNEKLETLAMCDSLTGLKNHRALQERLTTEFKRSMRYGSAVSVLLVDVDRFKKYNDSYGHLAGDKVLREVAAVLTKSMRDTDFVARYGGEEFVVVLSHTDYMGALEAAERLRVAIEQAPWDLIRVTASIGVATAKPQMSHHSDLIAAADLALYHCKQHGRNQVIHAVDLPNKPTPEHVSSSELPVDLDDRSTYAK